MRAAEDPRLLRRLAERRVTCEVCPASNVALGVYEKPEDVPLRTLYDAGVPMALGADDPLLFGSRLAAQYELARERARLHRRGTRRAGPAVGARLGRARGRTASGCSAGIDDWLADPEYVGARRRGSET